MRCVRCQHENAADARFCSGCGQPLGLSCPACGTANLPDNRFCSGCGQAFPASIDPGPPRSPSSLPLPAVGTAQQPGAERRQLTVLFCDLAGSTALSERLDPEELREVVRAYQAACAEVIGRFDGHIAQYLGDGLLVYFGYPQAHEDDAQRAVRAALGIAEAIRRLTPPVQRADGARLAVRVGIHTGLVVVGEVGGGPKRDQLALGETPNVAARLQALAEPDTVVISAATKRLVQGLFVLRDLGRPALKGVSAPVAVFQVLGESETQNRLDVAATTGLTPLVGREQEVGLLLARWEQVTEGRGQVVLLSGEPGIGKSRLVQVVKDGVPGTPHRRLECRGSPYYQHTPLYPVIDLLPRVLEWRREDAPDGKFAKLEERLADYPLSVSDVVPLLASLLSLPPSDRYPLPPMSPERQKQKTLEAVVAVLLAMAAAQPVLLVIEDLHWIDPTTLELLTLLLDQIPTARLLTLLTARPSFGPPWTPRAHLTLLTLTRFPRKQTELMVSRVAGGKALPAEVVQQIVGKTDGVPLFVEELTKMVLESGLLQDRDDHYELTGPLPPLAIPSTLQDSLMARLDRLATVKEVAQLGATLGRAFPYELLRAVSPLDDAKLQQELGRLVEAELLYQRGVPPQATYTFKHALIQEAAYESLLRSTRQQYHQRIAQVLVERFPEVAETRPEFVAHHYTEAGLSQQAVEYWQRAGQRAVQRSAYPEAIAHFDRALAVLATCPESDERDQREIALQIALGYAVIPAKGWTTPEAERAFTRARVLSQRIRETPLLFAALWGLRFFYWARADYGVAEEFAEQCVALAERAQDPDLQVEAYGALGWHSYQRGEFNAARGQLDRSIRLYDRERHRSHAFLYGQDPCVASLLVLSFTLRFLGYPEQAMLRARENLALARELSHPFSLPWALQGYTWSLLCLREWREAQVVAEENIALSTEQGFPLWVAWATVLRGLALAKQGQHELGIAQLKQALLTLRAAGSEFQVPLVLSWLAEACACAGQAEEGLGALAEALALIEKTGEHLFESEIWRLRGELLLIHAVPDEPQAETCFGRAIEIARSQEAKSFELRAASSLSRLWQRQGKRADARRLLGDVYGWFTEGFDTADLKDAKALLDELQ